MRRNVKTLLTNATDDVPLRLMTQRSANAESAPQMWSLIGGCAREGEATGDAAGRLVTERVGLTDQPLRCMYEWVQSGTSTPVPALRSLWASTTDARTNDLSVNVVRAGAFLPAQQVERLPVTDTTAVALRLAMPDLVPTLDRTPRARAVLLDHALAQQPGTRSTSFELSRRGYMLGSVAANPDEPADWLTPLANGDTDAIDTNTLLHGRPDPDLHRCAATRLGLAPNECVYVAADRLALVAASAAGTVPIRLAVPDQPETNSTIHAGKEPWPVIGSLEDVTALLRGTTNPDTPNLRTGGTR